MQSLSVEKDGILYAIKCALLFNGSSLYLILYFAVLIFILVKGKKELKEIFLYPALIMLFTVYNPVFPLIINKIFDINKEYYRFLWITPTLILLSTAAVYIIFREGNKKGQGIFLFIGILLILMGAGCFTFRDGYQVRENPYSVPNEVLTVSRMIRNNTDMKYPVAIMDQEMHMEIRQYDPSILLACDRTQYLDFVGGAQVDEQTAEENRYTDVLLSALVEADKPDKDVFLDALDNTNTQFVVVLKEPGLSRYLTDAGLKPVGTTGRRVVFRYDLKEPVYYDLADYSGIWEEQFR